MLTKVLELDTLGEGLRCPLRAVSTATRLLFWNEEFPRCLRHIADAVWNQGERNHHVLKEYLAGAMQKVQDPPSEAAGIRAWEQVLALSEWLMENRHRVVCVGSPVDLVVDGYLLKTHLDVVLTAGAKYEIGIFTTDPPSQVTVKSLAILESAEREFGVVQKVFYIGHHREPRSNARCLAIPAAARKAILSNAVSGFTRSRDLPYQVPGNHCDTCPTRSCETYTYK